MIRAMHGATRQTPFKTMRCADMGDVAMSPVDQDDALAAAEAAVAGMLADGIRPLMVGGDHLCTLTVLRALRKHRGEAFGLVLLDSHTDLYPPYFGGRTLTHGNPFRQAIEEGCLDPHRVFMAGMRGTSYNKEDIDYGREKGVHIVEIEACMARGWTSVMEEARAVVGEGRPMSASTSISSIPPMRPAPARRRWAGRPVSRRCNACARSGGSTSSGRTWWRSRRPSIRRGGRAGWACR
jgi:guanidinopropionase